MIVFEHVRAPLSIFARPGFQSHRAFCSRNTLDSLTIFEPVSLQRREGELAAGCAETFPTAANVNSRTLESKTIRHSRREAFHRIHTPVYLFFRETCASVTLTRPHRDGEHRERPRAHRTGRARFRDGMREVENTNEGPAAQTERVSEPELEATGRISGQ